MCLPGATDVFTYTYADKNGASSTATLTIEVLPETVAAPDSKGVHKGTAFDDVIDGADYTKATADGYVTIDGGGGQDLIDASGTNASHLIGGAGNDFPDRRQRRPPGRRRRRRSAGRRRRYRHRQLCLLEERRHRRPLQQQQECWRRCGRRHPAPASKA